MKPAHEREALRQQMMLRAIWRDARPGVLAGWTRDGERFTRGLQAYQANAGALAERALAAAYPTVQQLLGEESFAALARIFWQDQPPERGDVAAWGDGLPAFVEGDAQLASEPYLADLARLEWALHLAQSAADSEPGVQGLERLADTDPDRLRLLARPGTALVASAHPVLTIWQAHRSSDAERFVPVRAAFAEGRAEAALVWREGWRVRAGAVAALDLAFTRAVLAGTPLAAALAGAGAGFSFEPWLIGALQQGWLAGAEDLPT
ncbi:putative DNA-binding domain-containing protein [Rubrivivax sp. A210]|uniref:HvfC/BufC family peptide modification chaperone n=1 Tax=Rubrivivax sp. A210 TaxID=2772301 RepID=UPI00191B68B8|nr:putative DNA-binding domain-containing protein [Rubrivivax sp. A210]